MKEQAQNIIAASTLSQEDQQMWFIYFESAPEVLLGTFVRVFQNNVEDLPFATKNLKEKVAADGDIEKMKAIVCADKQTILNAA